MRKTARCSESGFSLLEPVMVMAIIALLASLINNLPGAVFSIKKSRDISVARQVANQKIENLRKTGYDNLIIATDPIPFSDLNLAGLKSPVASFSVSACPISICTLGGDKEQAKLIKIDLSWQEQDKPQNVTITTLISKGGLAQ